MVSPVVPACAPETAWPAAWPAAWPGAWPGAPETAWPGSNRVCTVGREVSMGTTLLVTVLCSGEESDSSEPEKAE